jgi:Zn-dependent protease
MSTGMMITAAAGPLSNLALAVICTVVYGVLLRVALVREGGGLEQLLTIGITENVALFLFNFLPVPPLDGSRIVDGFLPYRFRRQWDELSRYSWVGLLLVVYFGGTLLAVPMSLLIGWIRMAVDAISGR